MNILKYFILPLAIIVLSTLFIVYNPTLKIGNLLYISSVSVVFGCSLFPFYYIFCRIYPDNRNTEMPPQFTFLITLIKKEKIDKEKLAISRKTKAFKLTATFVIAFICLGFYLWE